MGKPDAERSGRAVSKGARTGGLKEKPKMASRITSWFASADLSVDSVALAALGSEGSGFGKVGMRMFVHWMWRRYVIYNYIKRAGGKGARYDKEIRLSFITLYMSFNPG